MKGCETVRETKDCEELMPKESKSRGDEIDKGEEKGERSVFDGKRFGLLARIGPGA